MRKSKIKVLLLIALVLSLFMTTITINADTPKVYDKAGLFTKSELGKLEESAAAMSEKLQQDIVIVTIKDNNGKTSQAYADDFYDQNGFGYGTEADGLLLLINMDDREVYISTCGKAIQYFNDERIQNIISELTGELGNANYYAAADLFINEVNRYVEMGLPTIPSTQPNNSGGAGTTDTPTEGSAVTNVPAEEPATLASKIPAYIGISFGIAFIIIITMVRMHYYIPKTTAVSYLKNGSISMIDEKDRHVDTRVTSHRINTNTGSSGSHSSSRSSSGGSSTHTSSSGRTHGGGGGKF